MLLEGPFTVTRVEMHDEIFHFEIFKKIHENFEILQDPFLKYFMKLLIFNIKWLKTFKTWLNYIKLVGDT